MGRRLLAAICLDKKTNDPGRGCQEIEQKRPHGGIVDRLEVKKMSLTDGLPIINLEHASFLEIPVPL